VPRRHNNIHNTQDAVSKPLKIHTPPLFLLLLTSLLIIIRIAPIQANPALNITVKTDKQKYYAKDTVQVYGNLTLDEVLVTDGLVGIQIQTSKDQLLTIRTLSTGNPPPETPYVFIEYVAPCDQNGNLQFSFQRGTLACFKISVANLDIEPREALMTINTYYADNTPFGCAAIQTTISPRSNPTFGPISIPIPADAVLGTTTVYANAYTDWPKLAGTPYCSEVNATFQIVGSGGSSQSAQGFNEFETNETGNFNLTLSLPRKTPYGNCTVYVATRYLGESTFNSTTFEVYILGDLGGPVGYVPTFFAYDGKVDGYDLALFIQCYRGLAPPEAMYLGDLGGPVNYVPTFFAYDGKVDGYDLALFIQCYRGLGP